MSKIFPGKTDYWYYLYGIFMASGNTKKKAEQLADWYSSDEYSNQDNSVKDLDSVTSITRDTADISNQDKS